jgi:ABC-type cobalamin/Fe3+-siderophores transport system ATPase subunit
MVDDLGRKAVARISEPTPALDISVQSQVIDLLKDHQARYGMTYLFISHNLKVVRAICHRVMVMRKGRIVEGGDTELVIRLDLCGGFEVEGEPDFTIGSGEGGALLLDQPQW